MRRPDILPETGIPGAETFLPEAGAAGIFYQGHESDSHPRPICFHGVEATDVQNPQGSLASRPGRDGQEYDTGEVKKKNIKREKIHC